MTIAEANKYLISGDKARIARKFGCDRHDVWDVASGRRKGKFGRAKEIAAAIIEQAQKNIEEGLFTKPDHNE